MSFFGVSGAQSDIPYVVNNVTIIRNGIPTVTNGKAFVQEVSYGSKPSYRLNVQSDNINFYDAIANKTLSDLDLSSLTHNIDDYQGNTNLNWQDGYTYPLIDTGYPFDDGAVNVNYQTPCLFYKWVWNKIWEEAGFTYEYKGRNNVFNAFDFEDRVFTVDRALSYDTTLGLGRTNEIRYTNNQTINKGRTPVILNSNEDTSIYSRNVLRNGLNVTEIKVRESAFIYFQFTSIDTDKDLVLVRNGKDYFRINNANSFGEIYLTNSDVITLELISETDINNSTFNLTLSQRQNSDTVDFRDYFGKVNQKDFIKSVMQDYGLIHQKNKDNVYEFITINDLFFKNENTIDWSDKFSEKRTLSAKIDSLAQENILSYQYENDDNFADGSFFIDNQTLREQAQMFRSIFRASENAERKFNLTLFSNNFWSVTDNEQGERNISANGKKMYSYLISRSDVTIKYRQGGNIATIRKVYPIADFRDITYNVLASKFYNIYSLMLQRFEMYRATFLLSAIDVYQLDFFKLHYVKQLGGYFYINKIINYNGNSLTEVELVKASSVDVKGEFNMDFNTDFRI